MRILGLCNPTFQGVMIATKAISTDFCPVNHIDNGNIAAAVGREVASFNPSVLVVGGWSRGYDVVLAEISKTRKFPILSVFHGTHFHGHYFGTDAYLNEIASSHARGHLDHKGYVHHPTAHYERTVRGKQALWVPHYFQPHRKLPKRSVFRIGILGGSNSWYKNAQGALLVAQDFCRKHQNCEVISNASYDKRHEDFLKLLESCSVLIHTSHLECYSNTIQEAWARGIPVISSAASSGLVLNPLLDEKEQRIFKGLMLADNIDPMQLYRAISEVHTSWEFHSSAAHATYMSLSQKAQAYTKELMKGLVLHWKERKPFNMYEVFDRPFKAPTE